MNLLVVESPAKAKTIMQYLGKDFQVVASFGHIRQLPSKNGSVAPEESFKMKYQIIPKSQEAVKKIIQIAKKSDNVYLASDPDREGEAIAQAVFDVLSENKIKANIYRVTFNEITKKSVIAAIEEPRQIDKSLVDAQQARLALDYLVGFNLSPVLWRKLPGSKSAGRVQSVALRMIVDREGEIKKFIPQEYWSIDVSVNNNQIVSKVISCDKKSFSYSYPNNEEIASLIEEDIKKKGSLKVIRKEAKDVKRNPYPPFTTALLQQEASKKLGFSSKKTMQVAQKLYEGISIDSEQKGLITYMRTDGMSIGDAALNSIRDFIKDNFGVKYLPEKKIIYKTKAKNAQEAHEAIRPIDINLTPEILKKHLDKDFYRLYDLIWKRTVACQMAPAIQARESIDFETGVNHNILTRVTGSRIKFDGFLKVYNAKGNIEIGDEDLSEDDIILPDLALDQILDINAVKKEQHFTSPPPRYTEATLIKNLESFGIGRPSTYAAIISVLQDREYVRIERRQFFPETRGIVVVAFLKDFFSKYVEYDFTAKLENDLDLISDGKMQRVDFLSNFWLSFEKNVTEVMKIEMLTVLNSLTDSLFDFLAVNNNGNFVNICPECNQAKLKINIGQFGPFIGCSNYPNCKFIRNKFDSDISDNGENSDSIDSSKDNLEYLGDQGEVIVIKNGKFGRYLNVSYNGKSKNCSFPATIKEITRDKVLFYSRMPITLGQKDNLDIVLNIGKFGPYILYNKKFYSIKNQDIETITLEKAIEIVEKKK
jgi:DNA topoisomerase-1